MKITKIIRVGLLTVVSLMLFVSGNVLASGWGTWVPGLTKAKSGTIVCGGFYKQDLSQRARWVLRNVNEESDINIERVRLYNKYGDIKLDSLLVDPNDPSAGIPPGKNGILGPYQSILAPHQTERYNSENLPPITPNISGPGNVQVIVDWSSEKRVIPPEIVLVRHVYDSSGSYLRARSSSACNRIK